MRKSTAAKDGRGGHEQLRAELEQVKRALGVALAELCRINSGVPTDSNQSLWQAFEAMGGDGDALDRSIVFVKRLKKSSSAGHEEVIS